MSDVPPSSESADVVAKAGTYYRNARYIVVAATLALGCWFAYDGWVKWPAEIARFNSLTRKEQGGEYLPHKDFDVVLQRVLAAGLIPLAPLMLGWFLYRSRGEYRLSGTTLQVPGHPPVPFEAMKEIDKSKWDRKGIAYVEYLDAESGDTDWLTLDDFLYQRDPTDRIVARIEAWLTAHADTEESEDPAEPEKAPDAADEQPDTDSASAPK